MKHILKIEEQYLDTLLDGSKTFEVRYNDRGYQKGDTLAFHYHNASSNARVTYFKEEPYVEFEITYVHSGLGMDGNYVVLAVDRILPREEYPF